jgi:hypothetical protein
MHRYRVCLVVFDSTNPQFHTFFQGPSCVTELTTLSSSDNLEKALKMSDDVVESVEKGVSNV